MTAQTNTGPYRQRTPLISDHFHCTRNNTISASVSSYRSLKENLSTMHELRSTGEDPIEMFSTRSSVAQLKPSTILEYVEEAEEQRWAQGDVGELVLGSHEQQELEAQSLGSILLSQSTSLRKTHGYFSQLESRKCCLHLACQRSTFNSMRFVPSSVTADDGSAKSGQPTADVKFLENKELRAFKHAYLCAVYPVLAAPEPPSPLTPSPVILESSGSSTSTFLNRTVSFTSTGGASSTASSSFYIPQSSSAALPRPITPYSLHDSGVEESEEAGLIPMESVCEQLQRAFRLSGTVFQQYEHLIVKTYSKKSSQRLLAEELSGQLAVLETNSHPFYAPKHFITQNGYNLWQKQERKHISELLNKFWNSSLPFPRDNQDLIAELHSVHEDYHILLKKLLAFESQFRQGSEALSAGMTYQPLSSASCRLLLEFGLRYGIGELFRKVLLLQCLTCEFSPTVGYLLFMNNLVVTIQQMLPSSKAAIVMVRQEFDILYSSLRVLKVQACKALSQMKRLFPSNKPADGVELLLMLLKSVLGLMGYLAPSNLPQETFETCIKATVQSIFKSAYEMFKSVAWEDLNRRREGDLDPRMLNILIQDIREDVTDYKTNFESMFEKYFSISKMAARQFYQFLMKDVESMSQSDLQHRPLVEIDLRMLALAYRLNTLDTDWTAYITPDEQTWRVPFLSILAQWTTAVRVHLQNLVLDAVAGDAYTSQKLELPQPVLTYQTAVTPSDTHSISYSLVSMSPSVNSAFNSIISSVNSTPHPDRLPENPEIQVPANSDDLDDSAVLDFGLTEYEMRPSEKSHYDTKSLNSRNINDRTLYFSAHRRFSLPAKLDEAKSNQQFTINQQFSGSDIFLDGTTEHQAIISRSKMDGVSSNSNFEEISRWRSTSQKQVLTPVSLPSSDNEEKNDDYTAAAYESGDEEFNFPPLKIVSQRSTSNGGPSDFSRPVFSMPRSSYERDKPTLSIAAYRNHILRTHAPHSMSSRASSITPDMAEDEHDFVECLESGALFPHPSDINQAVMPVSGSTIDILVMLQRLCSFCSNLVHVILAERSLTTESRQSSFQTVKHFFSGSAISSQCSLGKAEMSSIYERTLSSVSSKSNSSATSRPPLVTNRDAECIRISTSTQEDNNNLPQSDAQRLEAEDYVSDLTPMLKQKMKLALHLRMLKAMCNMLIVYSSNILCMDLCATTRSVAKRLLGPKLVEFIESQQIGGLIWGCRHQAEASYDCLFYVNRKTKLLSDRHEPVTQHMCTRINNIFACLHILDAYQKKLLKIFNIEELGDAVGHIGQNNLHDSSERRNSDVSEDYVCISHQTMQDDSLLEDSLSSDSSSTVADVLGHWLYQCRQVVDMTHQHLMATLTGICRLLAYKLNLFVKDGLYILLQQKHPTETIVQTLAPVTTFLQKYLDCLSTWLYHDCFRRVLDTLWVLIVQNIELNTDELRKSGTSASAMAHNWMLTVSHLIKFMNNSGKGIKKDLLLAQANHVIFQLQLYTLSTSHLIALFHSLRDYYFEGDGLTLEENAARKPPAIIHRIHHELQSLRKSFSGAELVHWILKNKEALPADLSLPSENVTTKSALTICQFLLDNQFIAEVDAESRTNSMTPISFTAATEDSMYPQVVIHSQGAVESSSNQRRSHSCSSNSTIENVQTVQAEVHDSYQENSFLAARHGEEAWVSNEVAQDGNSHREYSQEVEDTTYKYIQHQGNGFSTRSDDVIREINANSNNILNSVHQNGFYDHREKHNMNSPFEDTYINGSDQRHTPFSSLTEVAFHSNSKKFMASSKKFYHIHQSILYAGTTNGHSSNITSDNEHNFQKLKPSTESLALIEQCFTHKLRPIAIAAIIAGRKKSDPLAKNFVKQLPKAVSEKVSNMLDEPTWQCITC